MKTLYLVRHGKSSWRHHEVRDIERPLKKRGVDDAGNISQHLKSKSVEPELLISSPAKRALDTAKIFAKTLKYPVKKIEINPAVYGSSVPEFMTIILGLDNSLDSVMIFGHDPTLTNLSTFLTGKPFEKVPTSGVVCIEFNMDEWNKITESTGHLSFFIYPKMLL